MTRRSAAATRKPLISETVSIGHTLAGTVNQTSRGFELFGADGKYLQTEMTIHAARKALYERASGLKGAA